MNKIATFEFINNCQSKYKAGRKLKQKGKIYQAK